jgi:hypothetical protein
MTVRTFVGSEIGVVVAACLFCGCQSTPPKPTSIPVDKLGTADVSDPSWFTLQGKLRKPVGTYVDVEGTRWEEFKAGVRTLKVEKVDGQALDHPVPIWVCDLDLKKQTPYKLRGYESIEMIGAPYDREHPDALMPQAGFQIRSIFVATEIIAPEGEKLQMNN